MSKFSAQFSSATAADLVKTILANPTHHLPSLNATPADKGTKHADYINALFDGIYKHLSEGKKDQ